MRGPERGHLHLITQVQRELEDVFVGLGFQVAEQRPDKIKGIVAVEAASPGKIENAPKLKDVPVLQIFGDYVD